jgi:hypothetical protein
MEPKLPTDEETNILFDAVVSRLRGEFGRAYEDADTLAREYYIRFRDPEYCHKIHIPVQDDDFFHHEAPHGIAVRIYYYLVLKGDPDPDKFIDWRAEYYRRRRQA